ATRHSRPQARDPASIQTRDTRHRSSFRASRRGRRAGARCPDRRRTAPPGGARPDDRSLRLWRRALSRRMERPRRPAARSSPEPDAHGLALADLDQRLAVNWHLRIFAGDGAVDANTLLRDELTSLALACRECGDNEIDDGNFLL